MNTESVENPKYIDHIKDRNESHEEREKDRVESKRSDNRQVTVCFDLENVNSLPRAEVKNIFYKRKLSVCNLTAHCSKDRSCYNVIWTEADAG
ncbi:hypothetical protein DPMN_064823 [Dreissena polymorpha]|uniref:Uncharacterized protein n=1 Tax=Dreissena polymorpha TaxID=45954 RepID=A0A9D4CEI8_DREPO|nr:hypothetical protein DPMN_064823 [Dreissena polymorpha]